MRRLALVVALLLIACRAKEHGPTLVFEAGLGDSSAPWSTVAARAKSIAPVFTYDRAGLGTSPPTPAPRTPKNIAAELHERLAREHVAPPYVLVSHSAGAWYALQFASDYRNEVAGLIMIDPTPPDFFDVAGSIMPPWELENLTADMAEYRAKASPGRAAEWDARGEAEREVVAAKTRRDLPVTIITADVKEHSPAVRQWWGERHEQWAKEWPLGRHVTVKCGHYVQLEKPDAVLAEITRMVSSLRLRAGTMQQ